MAGTSIRQNKYNISTAKKPPIDQEQYEDKEKTIQEEGDGVSVDLDEEEQYGVDE